MRLNSSVLRLSATVLTLAAATDAIAASLNRRPTLISQVIAQAPQFTLPDSLPADTVVRVDGSSSMRVPNEGLKGRFEGKYSGSRVELAESGSIPALEALDAGNIDIAAIGRPLTEADRAKGFREEKLEREKIAVIVGPNSAFDGDLTFEQFARMFKGEITNWSEVGGPNLPIKFVDRPDSSDTRLALSGYDVFKEVFAGGPIAVGANGVQVAEDTTEAVTAELGENGISYTIADQAIGNSAVKIVPMHKTLPDDPRYPYSQPRAYVYKDLNPGSEALLGFATTAPGQEVFAAASPAASPSPSPVAESPSPTPTPTPTETVAAAPAETAPARGGFPWWLLPLLAAAGGLLWWLTRPKAAPAPVVAAPPVPLPPPVRPSSRVVLTPYNCRDAYAYWELTDDQKADLKRRGGRDLKLKLLDVTDIDLNRQEPHSVQMFDVAETDQDRHLPIAVDDRDYLVEVGYTTADGTWLPAVRSEHVRVPACPVEAADIAPVVETPETREFVQAARVPGVAVLGGAAAAGAALVGLAGKDKTGRIVLTPRDSKTAYAYWEVPDEQKADLKAKGGRDFKLKLYDVTNIDLDKQSAHDVKTYDVSELDQDYHVPIATPDRDYLAEVGYTAADGTWLPAARSEHVRVPSVFADGIPAAGAVLGGVAAGGAAIAGLTQPTYTSVTDLKVDSKANCFLLSDLEISRIQNDIAVKTDLAPGKYAIRIAEGAFDYKAEVGHPGEPWVILWIYNGKVINQKTGVPVGATWSTLNGYDDVLHLEVLEPAKLDAFFVDTHLEDNEGVVKVVVTKE
ncbi:DUF4912 domain-containing protein [Thermoleptolyngbya sichuanensis A183]|uniref:DUF4912 domain-containing protein n=1 Tax=Thermoleptolyngbya sichuanensis A183 TaxID=2737172 RepID=A0A6M8BNK5_9CYAN|nr:DUF4912 domain-containing protein [Thermoleptolyngbya sichuanensis]QKD83895.1 DUF4912 domain-containing protein [Thermoleptolyngbya sichuanensis A183]